MLRAHSYLRGRFLPQERVVEEELEPISLDTLLGEGVHPHTYTSAFLSDLRVTL